MPVSITATIVDELPVVTAQAWGASISTLFALLRPQSLLKLGSLGYTPTARAEIDLARGETILPLGSAYRTFGAARSLARANAVLVPAGRRTTIGPSAFSATILPRTLASVAISARSVSEGSKRTRISLGPADPRAETEVKAAQDAGARRPAPGLALKSVRTSRG